jgi:hypothetical protein
MDVTANKGGIQVSESGMDRREFTLQSALAILSAAVITIWDSACGSSPTAPESAGSGDKTGAISANHGHVAIIRSAQLMAGNAVSLDIQGTATHPHTVELSAAEIVSIGNNGQVSKQSSATEGHNHTVTFN